MAKSIPLYDQVGFVFRVNTAELLSKIGRGEKIDPNTLEIFSQILAEVANKAIDINDNKLNALMCRLGLYSVSDPGNVDYDKELTELIINKAYNIHQ